MLAREVDLCLAQPSSEKLPPVVNENKYRDSQPYSRQNVRDLGTLSLKEMSPSNAPWQDSGYCGRRGSQSLRAGGDGGDQGINDFLIYKRTGEHRNSPRPRQHALGLHGSAPDGVLKQKGKVDTHPISNPEVVSSNR